jgi:hypothetical protein
MHILLISCSKSLATVLTRILVDIWEVDVLNMLVHIMSVLGVLLAEYASVLDDSINSNCFQVLV